MQFRIRDLLSAATLLAMYLTGFLYAAQQLKPGELATESSMIVAVFAFHLIVLEAVHQIAKRMAAPFWLSFDAHIAWRPLFACGAIALVISFFAHRLPEGAFFVIALPFTAVALLGLIHRKAFVSTAGIFYQVMLFPWSIIERVPCESGGLRLRLGPSWWGLTIDVRSEADREAMEFVINDPANAKNEASEYRPQ